MDRVTRFDHVILNRCLKAVLWAKEGDQLFAENSLEYLPGWCKGAGDRGLI